jgi:hypothetical protein
VAEDDTPKSPDAGRSWVRVVSLTTFLAVSVPLVAVFALIGPYLKDDRRLDRIVRAVALDWRDFGREKAVTRLQYELDHERIGLQVSDEDCVLDEPEPGTKRVRCAWQADVQIPLIGASFPLAFESEARVGPDGDLR